MEKTKKSCIAEVVRSLTSFPSSPLAWTTFAQFFLGIFWVAFPGFSSLDYNFAPPLGPGTLPAPSEGHVGLCGPLRGFLCFSPGWAVSYCRLVPSAAASMPLLVPFIPFWGAVGGSPSFLLLRRHPFAAFPLSVS